MKIHIVKLLLVPILGLVFAASGCKNRSGSETTPPVSLENFLDNETQESGSVFYLIPSPGEILERFQDVNFRYNPDLLNNPQNKANYLTTRARSLNLGIYITDLAYCANFERTTEAINYLEAIKSLGNELNISNSVFESLIERARKEIGHKDSLIAISNEVFYEMLGFLEDGGKIGAIAMLSSGAFIESMYLTLESVTDFGKQENLIRQIEELKFPLENLLAQSSSAGDDPNLNSISILLNEVNDLFTQLDTNQSIPVVVKNEEGEISLFGGKSYTLTEDDLTELKLKVREIRNSIISY